MRLALALALACWSGAALAQDTTVPAPPAGSGTPDIILLNDGGMLRGTIVESSPGQYVVILLPTGETRRIDGASVRFAGPAASAPALAPATPMSPALGLPGPMAPMQPSMPPAGLAHVRLESPQEGVTFHRVTGTATAMTWTRFGPAPMRAYGYERLCTAPCQLDMVPSTYQFGLSLRNGAEMPAPPVDITGPGVLSGTYVDNSALRIGGWVVIGVTAIAGLVMMIVPALSDSRTISNDGIVLLSVGAAIALVGSIVGLIMTSAGDGAVVTFD